MDFLVLQRVLDEQNIDPFFERNLAHVFISKQIKQFLPPGRGKVNLKYRERGFKNMVITISWNSSYRILADNVKSDLRCFKAVCLPLYRPIGCQANFYFLNVEYTP